MDYTLKTKFDDCQICLSEKVEIISPLDFKEIKCGDFICKECWRKIGKIKPICPMCQRDISLWMVEFMKFQISTEMGYDPYIPFEDSLSQISEDSLSQISEDSLSQSSEDDDFINNFFTKNNLKNTMFCEDDFIDEICCSSLKFSENNFINNIFSENEFTVKNLVFTNEDGFTIKYEFNNDFVFTDENGFTIKYNIPEEDCFITKVCPYAKK